MILGAIGAGLVTFGLGTMCYAKYVLRQNYLELQPRQDQPKIAVLIPARDESRVVAGLLKSLQEQTLKVRMQDVYVIVERLDDPTIEICEKFGCQVVIRENLQNQRKGYALDEAVRQILPLHYDLYFVFDADNTLDRNYLEKMVKYYRLGYDMVTGYRCSKNANDNVIATMSGLTFSIINILGNRKRIRYEANVIFSGTGCFVAGSLVESWQGWPFHSLTEDYEMSLYAIVHAIPTYYNEEAVFYDEQPTKYHQTVLQRVRWIRGYFEARKIYIPLMRRVKQANNIGSVKREKIGVNPLIVILIGLVLLLLDGMGTSFVSISALWLVVTILAVVYLVLMLVTVVMLKRERLDLKPKIVIQTILLNPLYLVTYVPCALRAIFAKDVKWEKIEHGDSTAKPRGL